MTTYGCSEPGCYRKHNARGLCGMHYKQHHRNGTLPETTRRPTRQPDELAAHLGTRVAELTLALAVAHHHVGLVLLRWGQMTTAELHEHLLLLWQESAAGAVPDCREAAS